jgi:hypothetical protein
MTTIQSGVDWDKAIFMHFWYVVDIPKYPISLYLQL